MSNASVRKASRESKVEKIDEQAAVELSLFLDNDEPLYRQKQAIAANLLKKINRGTYNPMQAPQGWSYVVEAAAKKYAKEYCSSERDWSKVFPPAVRRVVAQDLADRWYANAKAGRPDEV